MVKKKDKENEVGRVYSSQPEGKIVLGRVNRRLEAVNFYLTEVRYECANSTDESQLD
jgi:hypothetical protein